MRKNELRKLRALNVTTGMMTAVKKEEKKNVYVRAQYLGSILKIAFFKYDWIKCGIKTPVCETFVNREGKEWITRILNAKGEEENWSQAMLFNLPLDMPWWREYDAWITEDAWKSIKQMDVEKEYTRKTCLSALYHWQLKIREEHVREEEKKEQKPWDEDMKRVPKIPDGLEEWMHRQCCDVFFLVYKYEKNQKTATCTRCGSVVQVEGLRNNVKKICPVCHVKALCKSEGKRMQTEGTGWYYGKVIQKIDGGIVEREFRRREWYRGVDFRKPRVIFEEISRILILDGQKPRRYEWESYKQKYVRWCLWKDWDPWGHHYCYEESKIYPPTMREARKTEIMKKSSFRCWKKPPMGLVEYMAIEQGNPAVEKLAKIGMFTLAEDLINTYYDKNLLKEDATELTKMLKIDAARLKRMKGMKKANIQTLLWMQREKDQNVIWQDKMIEELGEAKITPTMLFFLPPGTMTDVKKYNYLKKQAKLSGESLHQTAITWDDYYSMAGSEKMNLKNEMIYKPKDLKYAHDELIAIRNTKNLEKEAKEIEKKYPKVAGQLGKLKKFEFKLGKYQIVAPQKVFDIVREGMILKHCVHSCEYYFLRITRDESYLFFLRKTEHPDMPWYTLEVEPSGNIRQKRTTGDRQNKDFDDAVEFLKKWQQFFKKQLTKEEEELGIKADELRKKNYEQLRKEAKKVWHGPLAGQLLADVLESDFMEAI